MFFENEPRYVYVEGPDQNFWCVGVLLSKVCKRVFRGRRPKKVDDFDTFFKKRLKFLPIVTHVVANFLTKEDKDHFSKYGSKTKIIDSTLFKRKDVLYGLCKR